MSNIPNPKNPILCLDFDGVIHSYTSGWQGKGVVADPPVDGAMFFIKEAVERFDLCIYSSRSRTITGRKAMQEWLKKELRKELGSDWYQVYRSIKWPWFKPAALVTIDDRAIQFDGKFPEFSEIRNFKPWNRR